MPNPEKLQQIPDQELISLIRKDPDYMSIVYKKTKDYCLRFLYKMNTGSELKEEDLQEVYQNAVITLYEKIIYEDFQLTNNASIRTYLTSVCRFQLLNRFKKHGKEVPLKQENSVHEELQTDPSVMDELKEIKLLDERQYQAIEAALQSIQRSGGKCYEILTLFWYHRKSSLEIAELLGYAGADSVKNQKAKCQKRLRQLAYKELITA